MIIKEDELIIYKFPAGKYSIKTQEEVDALKQVFNDDLELIHTKDNIVVEWDTDDINWFAGQHIEKYYPLWKQSNITREGGDNLATMNAFIDAVREWSNQDTLPDPWDNTLEAITP